MQIGWSWRHSVGVDDDVLRLHACVLVLVLPFSIFRALCGYGCTTLELSTHYALYALRAWVYIGSAGQPTKRANKAMASAAEQRARGATRHSTLDELKFAHSIALRTSLILAILLELRISLFAALPTPRDEPTKMNPTIKASRERSTRPGHVPCGPSQLHANGHTHRTREVELQLAHLSRQGHDQ